MRSQKACSVNNVNHLTNRAWPFLCWWRRLLFPAAVLLVWELVVSLELASTYLLPPPRAVLAALWRLIVEGSLWIHLAASLQRVFVGFGLAFVMGLPLGILVGLSPWGRDVFGGTLSFLQHIPPIAWIPLFILWLGIGEASKNAVIAYAAFFPVFLNTIHGLAMTDPKLVEVGRLYQLSPRALVREIYLPAAFPAIFTGLRLGLGYSWRALAAAELIAAERGLGYVIVEARELSQPELVLGGVLVIGAVGMVLENALARLEKCLLQS
ncbi:MAG: ABC transporter permease [bacterium]|jgi:sulfonate transport system permease protein